MSALILHDLTSPNISTSFIAGPDTARFISKSLKATFEVLLK